MNKRTSRQLADSLVAILLALLVTYFLDGRLGIMIGYPMAVGLLPLVWLALRYGVASGIMVGALTGLILMALSQPSDWVAAFLVKAVPWLGVGLAGLFAKYTQKTLNNKRYSSTYLNIWTGSLLTVLVFYLLGRWLLPWLLDQEVQVPVQSLNFWLGALVTWLVISLILSLLARFQPRGLIPRRTRYLSRKETSSLLND
ncbi:energy-coupled thiamine transporter ThiT [Facklamia languida]